MSSSLPFWTRLHALGALDRTLDEAVRASDLAALWAATPCADVLLDVAGLAGVDAAELLRAARDVSDGPVLAGARRWAEAGLEALTAGQRGAATFALGRVKTALAIAGDAAAAERVREVLGLAPVEGALELRTMARATPEDDLAGIVGSFDRPGRMEATGRA